MTIRAAVDEDIPAIVALLKLSLGESLMPKSENFWRWKHIENPFGKSLVLVALEDDQLIGVRAFMRWEWKLGEKIYKSVRAVDTVTHPDHQGKGIFKNLTLKMVEQCKAEGIDFIFNTPNQRSKPGYLKMGWMTNGKLRLNIKPVIPWRTKVREFDSRFAIKNNLIHFNKSLERPLTNISTAVSQEFLDWRYCESPNVQYFAFSDDKNNPTWMTIFRLKPYRLGIEFRICDEFYSTNRNDRDYRKQLINVIRNSGANIVSSTVSMNLFPTLRFHAGPEITTYPLSFDHNFLTFNFWKPSLGDLEVF